MVTVLFGLTCVELPTVHWCSESRVDCEREWSGLSLLNELAMVQSSTYFMRWGASMRASFMSIKKSKGPSFVPCGTPQVMGRKSERAPWWRTAWRLLVRKSEIQGMRHLRTPIAMHFLMIVVWSTRSKAFLKSMKVAVTPVLRFSSSL